MLTPETLAAMSAHIFKVAGEKVEKKPSHPLVTAAKYLGAFGLGAGVGHGTLMLADTVGKKYLGQPVVTSQLARASLPLVSGLSGAVFAHSQKKLLKDMAAGKKRRGDEPEAS